MKPSIMNTGLGPPTTKLFVILVKCARSSLSVMQNGSKEAVIRAMLHANADDTVVNGQEDRPLTARLTLGVFQVATLTEIPLQPCSLR
jgi:methylthioribose-1-phosphate isomerase